MKEKERLWNHINLRFLLCLLWRPVLQDEQKSFLIFLAESTDSSVSLLRMCSLIKAVDNEMQVRILALADNQIPTKRSCPEQRKGEKTRHLCT